MDITCGRCRRSYFVPDDLVQGRTFRAKCSQCGHAFAVDVAAARGGAARAVADTLPSTSASAIPGFADALADADLGWLDEAAAKADAQDQEYFLLTVQRSRRGNALRIAAGAVVVLGAAAAIVAWMTVRSRLPEGGARTRAAAVAEGSAPVLDVGGLAARPDQPAEAPSDPAPGAAPAPPSRRRTLTLAQKDRLLLDLLGRKDDARPVGLHEEDAVESEKSALDPAAAEKVIAANRRAFDACVSKALRLHPDLKLARRATLVITVQPDGKVSQAALAEENVARSDLGVCLSEAARRMVFPGFDGDPLDIAMPLSLSATF